MQNLTYERYLKGNECQSRFPNKCHCAFRCLGNEFCNDAENEINRLKRECEIWQQKFNIVMANNADKTKLKLEIADLRAENEILKEVLIVIKEKINETTEA